MPPCMLAYLCVCRSPIDHEGYYRFGGAEQKRCVQPVLLFVARRKACIKACSKHLRGFCLRLLSQQSSNTVAGLACNPCGLMRCYKLPCG